MTTPQSLRLKITLGFSRYNLGCYSVTCNTPLLIFLCGEIAGEVDFLTCLDAILGLASVYKKVQEKLHVVELSQSFHCLHVGNVHASTMYWSILSLTGLV